ncbi:MAG: helix-turn-helix transcriptional regulator [Adlercreutzia sp.]|nr:helix-turn-helix transcriptional regulator [Adlercreutzia sp.]
MQISKYFRPETLMFVAFLATLPIYAPSHLLFATDSLSIESYMAPLSNAMLGATVVLGAIAALWSARRGDGLLTTPAMVRTASGAYVLGYGLLIGAVAWEGLAHPGLAVAVGLMLAFATVVLAVAWGAYLSQFNLKQALLWVSVMVALASLVQLLLSAVAFAIGCIVFGTLVVLACALPCWLSARSALSSDNHDEGAVRHEVEGALGHKLRSLASVVAMPFVGLMVFAFIMGARKFILFDMVHMEVLGCALGAAVVLPICFIRSSQPLMPLIYRLLVPLFCLVLIVLNAFPGGTAPMWLAGWLSYVFYGAVAILALASLCAAAHASEFNPGLIYGCTVAGFALCSLLGVGFSHIALFETEGGGPALLVVSTLYFAYLLASALFSPFRPAKDEALLGELPVVPEATGPDVAARCETLADECGLTPREREIFGYLGRGHGIAFVADTLVISESTVRTHVKSIYKKLGVGSREELLEKVDA